MPKLGPTGTARKTSPPAHAPAPQPRAPQPKAPSARTLPRSRPPTAPSAAPPAKPPTDEGAAALGSLLRSLVGLLSSHQHRTHTGTGLAVLATLGAIVDMVRRYLAAPATHRLVKLNLGSIETGLRLVNTEPPAPTPAPTPETPEQRARLAAGLRSLLSPPALAPAQRDLIPSVLTIVQRHIDLKNDLAHLASSLRYLEKEAPEGLRPMIACSAREVAAMQSDALDDEYAIACIAARVSGGSPGRELTQHLIDLALLLRAAGEYTDGDEASDIEQAHAAWTAAD